MDTLTYVPEIEEFYVGFEYLEKGVPKIAKTVFYINNAKTLLKQLSMRGPMITVKYLDQSDIESLGFVYTKTDKYNPYGLVNEYFKSDSYGGLTLQHYPDTYHVSLNDDNVLFSGKIKNKSELQKVLKMIGYECKV